MKKTGRRPKKYLTKEKYALECRNKTKDIAMTGEFNHQTKYLLDKGGMSIKTSYSFGPEYEDAVFVRFGPKGEVISRGVPAITVENAVFDIPYLVKCCKSKKSYKAEYVFTAKFRLKCEENGYKPGYAEPPQELLRLVKRIAEEGAKEFGSGAKSCYLLSAEIPGERRKEIDFEIEYDAKMIKGSGIREVFTYGYYDRKLRAWAVLNGQPVPPLQTHNGYYGHGR
jgi:hypothetical protein